MISHLVSDRVASPPDLAGFYAEGLLLVPPSYHANAHSHLHDDWAALGGARDNALGGAPGTARREGSPSISSHPRAAESDALLSGGGRRPTSAAAGEGEGTASSDGAQEGARGEGEGWKERLREEVSAWGVPREGVLMCNFNSLYKIDPGVMDTWLAILSSCYLSSPRCVPNVSSATLVGDCQQSPVVTYIYCLHPEWQKKRLVHTYIVCQQSPVVT